jgi:hypothetical protein
VKLPSDAQAALLALIAEHESEGRTVEWNRTPDYDDRPSRACLRIEHIDREANTVRYDSADGGRDRHRVATVRACLNAGWLDGLHTRILRFPRDQWHRRDRYWDMQQLDLTEDGVIALGVWRERKLNAPPAPLPTLAGRERDIAELALRAYELGYALSPREPARREARQMRRTGWFTTCWLANAAYGLVPSPMTLVELRPDEADVIAESAAQERPTRQAGEAA